MAKILVVDDDSRITVLCERILTRHGHEVSRASTKAEFMEAIQREKFDLLVADLRMPEFSGIECSEIARGLQPKIGIVIITGTPGFDESEIEWLRAVPFRLILKPFDPKDLEEAVETYLKTHRE